jgi:hypothetical protein
MMDHFPPGADHNLVYHPAKEARERCEDLSISGIPSTRETT